MTTTDRDRRRAPHAAAERRRGETSPTAALNAYIERQGLKHSRQREIIVEAFFAMDGHVTVEELVVRARKDDPRVSLATVYRTMKLLAECGLASARQFGDGQTRYEAAAGREHHDHLICRICGEIVEFSNDRIEALQDAVAKRHGFEVERHKLELYGRCAQCRRSARGREDAHP
jgi:Fur family transcriptional regulator, ferric uptake regulator